MLVLSRKKNEQIHIGNDITVTLLKVKGNTVHLGIDAPRHVRVLRHELTEALSGELQLAAGTGFNIDVPVFNIDAPVEEQSPTACR